MSGSDHHSMPMSPAASGRCVYIVAEAGHRASYAQTLGEVIGAEVLVRAPGVVALRGLMRPDYVLFGTVEDSLGFFLLVYALRALAGKRTGGLLLSTQSCFAPLSPRAWIRRKLYCLMAVMPALDTISIAPVVDDDRFRKVARYAIFDPQFWDLTATGMQDPSGDGLVRQVMATAGTRSILLYLGRRSAAKGIDLLAGAIAATPDFTKRVLLVVAGEAHGEANAISSELAAAGALVFDRRLSDPEVVGLKRAADCLWACYSAAYDSSSGLFGRALQLRKRVVVRRGSMLHGLSLKLGVPALPIDPGIPLEQSGQEIVRYCSSPAAVYPDITTQMRELSVGVLRSLKS